MRHCGECSLCCKIPRVSELGKAPNILCKHVARGCSIYWRRPGSCRDFRCLWLDGALAESARPDKVGFYVVLEDKVAKVYVDADRPEAWHSAVVEDIRRDMHVAVLVANQITFLTSHGLEPPERLLFDWTL